MNNTSPFKLPKFPLRFLKWFCSPDLIEDVEGDLSELFAERLEKGKVKARLWFIIDVLLLFRPGIIRQQEFNKGLNQYNMFSNYLKIAVRNALRYKGYTSLNLLGLVVGIASSVLVLLWIQDEVRIDKFHDNGDSIYQVFRNMRQSNGIVSTTSTLPKPAGDLMREDYSEIDMVAWMSWEMGNEFVLGEKELEANGRFVSPEFLEMFSFELLLGVDKAALNELNGVLISRAVAEKLFGSGWKDKAMGQLLKVSDVEGVLVTGVFENTGENSSLTFDWLLPIQALINSAAWVNDWGNGSFDTFVTINDPSKVSPVSERIRPMINDNTAGNASAGNEELILHKFEDTYLYSNFDNGVISGGRIDYVRIMTIVAIFILIVACINFMNLTTARSSRRSKEIGLRKVMGAPKGAIRTQFFFEAILLTFVAVVISVVVVVVLIPYFNNLVNKSLSIDFMDINTWYYIFGLILSIGLISGSYPAVLLPALSIIQSIKGEMKQPSYAAYFRKGLVVFQFAISTLLIIGTTVVYQQIDFVLNKDLGIDKDNLVAINLDGDLPQRLETYKSELMRLPEVTAVSAASGNPISYGRSTSSAEWEGKNPEEGYEVNVIISDEDFIETTGMEMLEGRAFSDQLKDSTNFIINEVAAKLMGFDDPVGKKLSFWGYEGQIIGVVKNFHMSNLYEPIAPLIITCIDPSRSAVALVRIDGNVGEVMREVESITKELNPTFDFRYQFIDQAYAESYESERTLGTLANIFALISILISSLGLLGLASYSAEQRSKEIGVRKVHGASVMQILLLLSKDYSKLIFIAFVLAIPFGYLVTQNWLDNFEFRTVLNPVVFIGAGAVTFLIGVFTVAAKSFQAATVNPVRSLKEE
ncbi:MAG: putative ABC transport system permease protein [Roseivirga sp.]|jgi:putative ABC transport system permease protein